MKECFVAKKFAPDALARIATADRIIADYQAQGLTLTLRQLYYQFVARHDYPNTERSYQNLGRLVSDARLAGLLDWDGIEDRARQPARPNEFRGMAELIEAAVRSYRLDRWQGQRDYVELWVEKDALAGVLAPLAREHHVTLMVNRGYSSSSAMYAAAQRFEAGRETRRAALVREGILSPLAHPEFLSRGAYEPRAVLLYLGDHDPSGEDMVRDVRDRLATFGVLNLHVKKLALTMAQVEQHDPPPNPAKRSDSRFERYAAEHGTEESWEVDALDPATLAGVIRRAFAELVDRKAMDAVVAREKRDVALLREAVRGVDWKAPPPTPPAGAAPATKRRARR